jgi:hypothetical protein
VVIIRDVTDGRGWSLAECRVGDAVLLVMSVVGDALLPGDACWCMVAGDAWLQVMSVVGDALLPGDACW